MISAVSLVPLLLLIGLPYAGALTIEGYGSLAFDADSPSTGVVWALDADGNVSFELDLDDYAPPDPPE